MGGPEPRLFGLSACLSRDTWRLRTFPSRGTGPDHCQENRTPDRRGPAVLDVVKDNYKALA